MPVVYNITCADCGSELIITSLELDTWGDLSVKVERCKCCCDEAYNEGEEEGKKNAKENPE